MLDHTITMFAQGNVGLGVTLGTIGLITTVFVVYYIVCTLWLIAAPVYSGITMLPESCRILWEDFTATYNSAWGTGELGLTMPDGGEPIDQEEKEEKEEKEA